MKKSIYIYILVLITFLSSCSKFQRLQKSDDFNLKLEAAMGYYEKGDYYRASLLFESVIPLLKGKKKAEDAQYYYAVCQYELRQLYMAQYYFKKFYQTFPKSKYTEQAYFMYAQSLYENSPKYNLDQSNTLEAIAAFQDFVNKYPKSDLKDKCNAIVDELQGKLEKKAYEQAKLIHRIGDYKAAVVTFGNFIQDFPQSQRVPEIYFLRIEAQYKLAKISIESKKQERYYKALDYYQLYIDKFEKATFTKDAVQIYDECLKQISALKKKNS